MSYNLPRGTWLPVSTWRPAQIVHSICAKFLFHYVRPAQWKVVLASDSGGYRNMTEIVEPKQVSLILGHTPGFFCCITVVSPHLDKSDLLLASEYLTYEKLGQAKTWYLDATNFFQGDFEVFNGPNVIDLSKG